jgi:hypothetical protein
LAAAIRHRIGVFDAEAFRVHTPQLDALRAVAPEAVAAGERRGAELTVTEAIALALPDSEADAVRRSLAQW